MTKILIAEDHQLFSDGLKALLTPHFDVVEQVFHGREVIHNIQKLLPDLVILDINLPGIDGLVLGRDIKKHFPKVKLVYLSMYNEVNFLKSAKDLNANGYLLKDSKGQEILRAIQKIILGENVFDERINQQQPNLHRDDYFVKKYALSKRELEVIGLVRQGLSSEQIAARLSVSFETVRSHRKNVLLKLRFNKTSELVEFAVKYNL
ncbi:MAG: response regulator transcription factor [Spirosomaceae bacterium]|jgi:DNA-binding NarL/FixJ family response regulator|nr:response regulator transcription factor [Spirosomataceae bacterium]